MPLLAKVAREILCIPASSSSSERAFSVGGLICTKNTNNLSPKKVEELALNKLNNAALKNYIDKNGVPEKKHFVKVDDFELEEDIDMVLEQIEGIRYAEIYDEAVISDLEDDEEADGDEGEAGNDQGHLHIAN